MSTPGYSELVAVVRREGEAILAAGRQGPDVAVPTCGDWTMRDLMAHVARVYRRAATAVEERATEQVQWESPPDDLPDPAAYLAEALEDLVHALASADADSPAWNWSADDHTAQFWARRMAHESAVHRYDAQRAQGLAQPIDADIAHDGIDELVDLIGPRILERDGTELPTGTMLLTATDEGARWALRLDGHRLERLDLVKEADVAVRGTASALLLAAYGRVPWDSLEIDGDEGLLDGWLRALRF